MFKIFLTRKEKIANKLYNSLFVKEYILENLKIEEHNIDALIISNVGIFVFKILEYEENNIDKINEFKKEVVNHSDFISSLINYKYKVTPFVIGDKLNKNNKEITSIEDFKDFVNNLKKIIPNNEIESIRKTILSLNNKNEIGM
ncbi:MAG: hypothetical protein SOX53_04780 [Candidatus Onthovivens sp.]|nr:hypothetical protein [Candidatus Onthovivens sp.]